MKLTKIKLSGFKSFVDPTTVQLQSNLTGVVGPNGCGKSNIIDAVRWVMGEISAKQLRGESMHDVIFNGSSARKPVGKAVAELVFDNSDASLGGEYAKYNEISIRREVNRDGFSDYFLNNVGCRRKDIVNIFLGTGLGPSSYALIEQGMISKFIDAKPDDLRVFIEEASGISKYKERRRETENRIRHTKENLARLNDILEEITKQLKHLRSQANAAERYRKLKQEERLTKAELHVLHWRNINKKLADHETTIQNEEARLENRTTELHVVSSKIATLREQHNTDIEKFNVIQEDFYKIGANIARLEQQIKHTKERQEQLNEDLNQVNQSWQETTDHQSADKGQIELLKAEKSQLESEIASAETLIITAKKELEEAEERSRSWQKSWDDFNANSSKVLQQLEVEQTRINHLEQRITEETQNLDKFKSELSDIDLTALNSELSQVNGVLSGLQENQDKAREEVSAKQQQITTARENSHKISEELNQARNSLQVLTGRKSSLEALQQAALGKTDSTLIDWLSKHSLDKKPRLGEELDVVSGWETAVETALGVYLEAVCVDGMVNIVPDVKDLASGNLILLDQDKSSRSNPRLSIETLASKIKSKLPGGLLSGIYVVEDINEAIKLQPKLNHDESIITKNGVWLGEGWLRVAYDSNPKIGILQREKELHEIDENISKTEQDCRVKEEQLAKQKSSLVHLEEERQKLQHQLHDLMKEYSEAQSKVASKKTHIQNFQERAEIVTKEIEERKNNLIVLRQKLTESLKSRDEASEQKISFEVERQTLIQNRDEMQKRRTEAREHSDKIQKNISDFTMRLQLIGTQTDYLAQSIDRADKRLVGLKEHRANIEKSLSEASSPLEGIEKELKQELEKRLGVEGDLHAAKQKVSGIEQELRELEQKHTEVQEANEKIRMVLERVRTEREGLQVRVSTYKEQIEELDFKLEEVDAELSQETLLANWEEKLTKLTARIERLGLINLAAIEEFEKLQERKDYLDAQSQDLINALNTLEEVMRKIDHDTKARFKEAYEAINSKFQELFPKVFNGGKAYLEQTSEDLLETGVMIMAQPPGKRNSSIHLLSGGEKASAAIPY